MRRKRKQDGSEGIEEGNGEAEQVDLMEDIARAGWWKRSIQSD